MRKQFLFKAFVVLLFYIFSGCGNNIDNNGPTETEVKEVITKMHESYNPSVHTDITFESIQFGKMSIKKYRVAILISDTCTSIFDFT